MVVNCAQCACTIGNSVGSDQCKYGACARSAVTMCERAGVRTDISTLCRCGNLDSLWRAGDAGRRDAGRPEDGDVLLLRSPLWLERFLQERVRLVPDACAAGEAPRALAPQVARLPPRVAGRAERRLSRRGAVCVCGVRERGFTETGAPGFVGTESSVPLRRAQLALLARRRTASASARRRSDAAAARQASAAETNATMDALSIASGSSTILTAADKSFAEAVRERRMQKQASQACAAEACYPTDFMAAYAETRARKWESGDAARPENVGFGRVLSCTDYSQSQDMEMGEAEPQPPCVFQRSLSAHV